jgi:F0F1-type ATP synthase assembly protein I
MFYQKSRILARAAVPGNITRRVDSAQIEVAMNWQQDILPVAVSIVIIILIAVLKNVSSTLAAITGTMPVNIPLSLWIFYASKGDDTEAVSDFIGAMIMGLVPTFLFVVVAWLATRAGWKLVPTLIAGYITWGVVLGIVLGVRRLVSG